LDAKVQLVRDPVRGVADGFSTGLYLWGEGGTSKSFTVDETLRALGKPYKSANSRVTGKGLFALLRDFPDVVHVLEDVETLFGDPHAFGVLRSALWGQPGSGGRAERLVTWTTGKERGEVVFTGGVVLVANRPLVDLPELRALATRITVLHFRPTNEEVAAKMRAIARGGHTHGDLTLSPDGCLEVADEVIARSQRLHRNLDLRLYVNACQDRLQWEAGAAETHWLDLLDSRMKERTTTGTARPDSRADRQARELGILRELAGLPRADRLVAWQRATGKSQAAMYRAAARLPGGVSHFLTSAGRDGGENGGPAQLSGPDEQCPPCAA
jgi:hypothetical protein